MKKLLVTILFLAMAGVAQAAGTCTVASQTTGTLHSAKATVVQVLVECTADASDDSYPEVLIENVGGYLMAVYVDPGTTAPTTAFDMTVELGDTNIDLLGGAGADIATAADAFITPLIGTPSVPAGFAGDLTLVLTNNSEVSATVDIYLILAP